MCREPHARTSNFPGAFGENQEATAENEPCERGRGWPVTEHTREPRAKRGFCIKSGHARTVLEARSLKARNISDVHGTALAFGASGDTSGSLLKLWTAACAWVLPASCRGYQKNPSARRGGPYQPSRSWSASRVRISENAQSHHECVLLNTQGLNSVAFETFHLPIADEKNHIWHLLHNGRNDHIALGKSHAAKQVLSGSPASILCSAPPQRIP